MFNSNYYGYGYPQSYQQSVYNQNSNNSNVPQQVQTIQNTQPIIQNQNVNWVRVSGIDEVKGHIVMPNQTVWFLDNNENIFYVKSADNLGTTTLKTYSFTEISDKINSKTLSPQTDINPSEYVRKDDIDDLIANKFLQLMDEYTNNKKSIEKENKQPKGGKNE